MAMNVELKARARAFERQRALAAQLANGEPGRLEQADTFFQVTTGRLKLRQEGAAHGELIYYHRPDHRGPKLSTYLRVTTDQPADLRELLSQALGIRGVVRKQRWLYWAGQTRIHLDEVDGLGAFLELEVVLRPEQTVADGVAVAEAIRQHLDIRDEDLIETAYIDLLETRRIQEGRGESSSGADRAAADR